MTVFAQALEAIFADPNISMEAIYTAEGGASKLVRIVARRADAVASFGEARLWSEATRVDLRVADVTEPRPGDRVAIGDEAFLVQGEPVRDSERLLWTLDLRQA